MEAAPLNLVLDIIAMRAYVSAKNRIDTARSEDDLPRSAMVDLALEIQAEIIREKRVRTECCNKGGRRDVARSDENG